MKINMKQLTPVLLVLAAVFLLCGIVLFAFLVPGASSTFYRYTFLSHPNRFTHLETVGIAFACFSFLETT